VNTIKEIVRHVAKHSVTYAFATVLNRSLRILLLPLYTHYLLKTEYGALEILFVTSSVTVLILQLGMGSAVIRSILYKKDSDKKTIICTAYYFLGTIAAIFVFILVLFSKQISILLLDNSSYVHVLSLAFIGDFFLILQVIPMARLRIEERSKIFALVAGANFVFSLLCNFLFVVVFRLGLFGVISANALPAAVFSVVYFIIIKKDLGISFSWEELRDMLGFGIPLVPAAIFNMVLMMSDRYFIKIYLGLDYVASYGVAVRLSTVMSLLVSAFQMAWPAVLFPIARKSNGPVIFAELFNYFLMALVAIGLGISIFSYDIISIFVGTSFIDGAKVIPLIIIAFIFYGVNYFSSIGVQVKKKTFYYPIVIGVAALINIIMNIYLIPRIGIIGAALAKAVAFAVFGISIGAISLLYYHIPYKIKTIAFIFFSGSMIYIVAGLIEKSCTFLHVMERLLLYLCFPLILYLLGYFKRITILRTS